MQHQSGSNWLQVGELTDGFGGHELELTGALAGRSVQALFDDGSRITLEFQASGQVRFDSEGSGVVASFIGCGTSAYTATSPRARIYFIDFLPLHQPPHSVSLVIDLAAGQGTAVLGRLPLREETVKPIYERASQGEELTPVATQTVQFSVAGTAPAPGPRHAPTTDLVGRRMLYDYGSRDIYEHVYLNERYYTWQCLKGPELGLADTDRCHHVKIAHELYLFVWREKIVPTLGVVVIDTASMHTTGKIFGYRGSDFGAVANAVVGARARLLNITVWFP